MNNDDWFQRALKAATAKAKGLDCYPEEMLGDAFEGTSHPSQTIAAIPRLPPMTDMRAACHQYLDSLENGRKTYVGLGVEGLDNSIDGISWGEMCVIAARPGHCKSALALQWLDSAIAAGHPSLLISEEMSQIELGKRMVAHVSDISQEFWDKQSIPFLRMSVDKHYDSTAPLYVVENCNSISLAEDVIDEACVSAGVKVVAVDYLQLLGSRGSRNRYEEVSDISRRLKQCAKRNNIAMIVCCQLNREIEARPDHTPKASDLRESGQIEQDSDLILLCVWSCKFDAMLPPDQYVIYCAKRRNGPIREFKVTTTFCAERQRVGPERSKHESIWPTE